MAASGAPNCSRQSGGCRATDGNRGSGTPQSSPIGGCRTPERRWSSSWGLLEPSTKGGHGFYNPKRRQGFKEPPTNGDRGFLVPYSRWGWVGLHPRPTYRQEPPAQLESQNNMHAYLVVFYHQPNQISVKGTCRRRKANLEYVGCNK